MSAMQETKTAIINQTSSSHTEQIGAYRFFHNENVSLEALIQASYNNCANNSKGKHILSIQDTSEMDFQKIFDKLTIEDEHIGPIGNRYGAGFFVHPNLAIDAKERIPIGFSSIEIWNRRWGQADKNQRNYKTLPIEEKESFRWISSVDTSKEVLKDAEHITIIGDRENDIYEALVRTPNERTDILTRSRSDRNLYDSDKKLFKTLEESELVATYKIEIKANKKRKNRIAKMELRYIRVKIARPASLRKFALPEYVEVWAIEAKEKSESVPKKEDPIYWRLLTTHEIKTIKDAFNYIDWYALRWQIEELFRISKSKGFNFESSQLGNGFALKKLGTMVLQLALQVMQLTLSREGNNTQKAELIFSKEELVFLIIQQKELEGKTKKQQNPYPSNSLAWAAWIIGRLGGWKGYKSQSPPGHITMKRGLDKFFSQYQGWHLSIQIQN